ncbi:hypothetical protein BGX26_005246, partial [Mortierella sp. AD094]
MGIEGLWQFLKKKGYSPTLFPAPQHKPLPYAHLYHLDLLGAFFAVLRRAYQHFDLQVAHSIVETHLVQSGFHKGFTVIYIDGPSPMEKSATQQLRENKRSTALSNAHDLLSSMEKTFNDGGRLRKQKFKALGKAMLYSFHMDYFLRTSLAEFLGGKGWYVVLCPSEADISIGELCNNDDIVVTGDSDSIAYRNISTIWRPQGRRGYLVYDIPSILLQLGLSRTALTSLAVTCHNDYTHNFQQWGLRQISKFSKSFINVRAMVQAYLTHLSETVNGVNMDHFDPAVNIFVELQPTVPVPAVHPEVNPVVALTSLRGMVQRLESLRQEIKKKRREQRPALPPGQDSTSSMQRASFIRYSTVDRPPLLQPPPHDSGRRYKYRERFAIKTRSRKEHHDPPEVYKQYERKPWRQEPERLQDSSTSASDVVSSTDTLPKEKKPREPMLPEDQRTKANLIKAMQHDHPFRTLDVGTVNANGSRAANRTTCPDGTDHKALEEIKTCLDKVTEHATTMKRTAQLALGQYLENLSLRNLDHKDRIILYHLCSQYSVQEKAAIQTGTISDLVEAEGSRENNYDDPADDAGEDHGSSNKGGSDSKFFFLVLLTALYNKEGTSGSSPAAKAVEFFLEKARANKYLPPMPKR